MAGASKSTIASPQEGSTFTVFLPVGGWEGMMAKEKILLVEDEKLIRWSLRQPALQGGVCGGGGGPRQRTRSRTLDEHEIDLVLLDYRLPDMDGHTGAQERGAQVPRPARHHDDGLLHRGERHRGHEARGLRLPEQALRDRRAPRDHPEGPRDHLPQARAEPLPAGPGGALRPGQPGGSKSAGSRRSSNWSGRSPQLRPRPSSSRARAGPARTCWPRRSTTPATAPRSPS